MIFISLIYFQKNDLSIVKVIFCDAVRTSGGVYVMRCAIWYHLYNLKNVKNTHGGVLFFVKLQTKACKSQKDKIGWKNPCSHCSQFLWDSSHEPRRKTDT